MYSYEDRVRAVKLYLKLRKRIRATIRQLGYPTRNSLISRHQQFERFLNLAAGYSRPRPKYSDEQKALAVEYHRKHGCCIAFAIRALGFPGRGLLTTQPRLPGWRAQGGVGDRHYGIPNFGRQGLPLSDDRLLRRHRR